MASKLCSYCGQIHDEAAFVRARRGRFGRTVVIMCRPCYEARKNPEAYAARMTTLRENAKLANRKAFLMNNDKRRFE